MMREGAVHRVVNKYRDSRSTAADLVQYILEQRHSGLPTVEWLDYQDGKYVLLHVTLDEARMAAHILAHECPMYIVESRCSLEFMA